MPNINITINGFVGDKEALSKELGKIVGEFIRERSRQRLVVKVQHDDYSDLDQEEE